MYLQIIVSETNSFEVLRHKGKDLLLQLLVRVADVYSCESIVLDWNFYTAQRKIVLDILSGIFYPV